MNIYFVVDQHGELLDHTRLGDCGPNNNFLGVICDDLQLAVEMHDLAITRGIPAKIVSTTRSPNPACYPYCLTGPVEKENLHRSSKKLLAEQIRNTNTPHRRNHCEITSPERGRCRSFTNLRPQQHRCGSTQQTLAGNDNCQGGRNMKVNQDGGVTGHLLSLAAPNECGPAAGKVNLEGRFKMTTNDVNVIEAWEGWIVISDEYPRQFISARAYTTREAAEAVANKLNEGLDRVMYSASPVWVPKFVQERTGWRINPAWKQKS